MKMRLDSMRESRRDDGSATLELVLITPFVLG